jgi:hypothetical protein
VQFSTFPLLYTISNSIQFHKRESLQLASRDLAARRLAAAMQTENTAAHCISINRPFSSLPNHIICCDRPDDHSDICFMAGDVRTDAASLSLLLFPPRASAPESALRARRKPAY